MPKCFFFLLLSLCCLMLAASVSGQYSLLLQNATQISCLQSNTGGTVQENASCSISQVTSDDATYAGNNLRTRKSIGASMQTKHNSTILPDDASNITAILYLKWKINSNSTFTCSIEALEYGIGWHTINTTCFDTEALRSYPLPDINTVNEVNNLSVRVNATGSSSPSQYLYVNWVYVNISYNRPPSINTGPSDGGSSAGAPTTVGGAINFTATANDSQEDQYRMIVCSTSNQTNGVCSATEICSSGFVGSGAQASCSHNTTGKSGPYAWYVFACDQYSLCSGSSQGSGGDGSPYVVNSMPPNATLNSPQDKLNSSQNTLSFQWTATDEAYFSLACNLTVDGILNKSDVSSPSGQSASETVAGLNDGTHNWSVSCWDGGGKVNSSETRTFIVDTVPPTLTGGSVQPASGDENTIFNYTINYTDNLNNLPSYVKVEIDGVEYSMVEADPSDTDYTDGKIYYYNTTLPIRTHNYSFKTEDVVNTNTTDSAKRVPTPNPKIHLNQGYNYVSLPLDPGVYDIPTVLSSINGHYSDIITWNPEKKKYDAYTVACGGLCSAFTTINISKSYWVYVTSSGGVDYTMTGSEKITVNVSLPTNVCSMDDDSCYIPVGWVSVNNKSAGNALSDCVNYRELLYYDNGVWKTYIASGNPGNTYSSMAVGRGYYLHANVSLTPCGSDGSWDYGTD